MTDFWTPDLSHYLLAGAGVALGIGLALYSTRTVRAADAVGLETDAVIAASGAMALVWPAEDDGEGWGQPDERTDMTARADLCARAGLPADSPPTAVLAALCAQSPLLGERIAALRTRGEAFKLSLQGYSAHGRPHGPQAVVWLTPGALADDVAGAALAPFPVWRTDMDGRLLWANATYVAAVEAGSLEAARDADLALDAKAREDARAAAAGRSSIDVRAVSIDGQRRALRISLFPAHDGAAGVALDVTEAAERREALEREVRAHGETLNHLTDAVAVFNAQRRLVTHNRAFASLWELEEAWLDERPSHGEWLDRLREGRRLPGRGGYAAWRARELEFYQETGAIADETWSLPDGRILRVARQRQPDGGLLILFEDISDTIGLQARFKTQLAVQRATLDKLGEAVAVFAADGTLSLGNAAFARVWGLEEDWLATRPDLGAIAARAQPLYPEPAFWEALQARVSDPRPEARRATQGEIVRRDQSCLTWLTRPLPDGATLVAFADVTAARREEELLTDKAAAFEEAARLKTEFVRNVSIQLRTPLTTIGGYAELLAVGVNGELNTAQNEFVSAIRVAATQLGGLIENILDMAMIDAGQMHLDLGDVHILDALEETAEFARSDARDSQVRIQVQCDSDVGVIRADNARIRQILFNLVSNALRFAQAGDTVTLGARRIEDTVRLWVSDTGQALDPARQAGAFDGFTDGDRRTGLSLALVKRFVELHGGWVAMTSQPGAGVTVVCHLPALAVSDHAQPELDLTLAS